MREGLRFRAGLRFREGLRFSNEPCRPHACACGLRLPRGQGPCAQAFRSESPVTSHRRSRTGFYFVRREKKSVRFAGVWIRASWPSHFLSYLGAVHFGRGWNRGASRTSSSNPLRATMNDLFLPRFPRRACLAFLCRLSCWKMCTSRCRPVPILGRRADLCDAACALHREYQRLRVAS